MDVDNSSNCVFELLGAIIGFLVVNPASDCVLIISPDILGLLQSMFVLKTWKFLLEIQFSPIVGIGYG